MSIQNVYKTLDYSEIDLILYVQKFEKNKEKQYVQSFGQTFEKKYSNTYEKFYISHQDLTSLNSMSSFEAQKDFLRELLERDEYHKSDIRIHEITSNIGQNIIQAGGFGITLRKNFDDYVFPPKTGITTYKSTQKCEFFIA